MTLTVEQMTVVRNIMYAVESGGQVYGDRDYAEFDEAAQNSPNEKAITIGAGGWYGVEAKTLLQNIRLKDKQFFATTDPNGIIRGDVNRADWNTYDIKRDDPKAAIIIALIDSNIGHMCQDALMDSQMGQYINEAEKLGVTTVAAAAMAANFRHQGGTGAMNRVVNKCKEIYGDITLENLYSTVSMDKDPGQVGTYTKRQAFVYENLMKYIGIDDEPVKEVEEPVEEEVEVVPEPPVVEKPVVEEKPAPAPVPVVKEEPPVVDKPVAGVTPKDEGPDKRLIILAQKKMNLLFKSSVREDGIWDYDCKREYVRCVQSALNILYNERLAEDGIWGPLTQKATGRHIRKGLWWLYQDTAYRISEI